MLINVRKYQKNPQNKIQKLYFSYPYKPTGQNWVHRGVKIYFSLTIQCILLDKLQVIDLNLSPKTQNIKPTKNIHVHVCNICQFILVSRCSSITGVTNSLSD